jgi:integrase
MACIRKRRGKWVADWRDGYGNRKWKSFDTRRQAEDFLDQERPKARQWQRSAVPRDTTLATYKSCWLASIQPTIKHRTYIGYDRLLTVHVIPILGSVPMQRLHRSQIRDFLAAKLAIDGPNSLTKNTVRNIHATLRAMLRAAVDDGLLTNNPAEKLGRQLRLVTPKMTRQENIKAMTREQRQCFLAQAQQDSPHLYPLFATLAGTGMRLGEVVALQWNDVNYLSREIRIERAFSDHAKQGEIQTPKSGHGRTVDLSHNLIKVLKTHQGLTRPPASPRAQPDWIFPTRGGNPFDGTNLRRLMREILKNASLPLHFTPHCLRHTYASLMLQQGESIVYVQRQLGHASIQLTVDTYGKWLPMGNKAAVDRLDGEIGSKTVATSISASSPSSIPALQHSDSSIYFMELARGIEPPTGGLQNRCSAN